MSSVLGRRKSSKDASDLETLAYFLEAYREPGGPPEAPPRDLPTEMFGSTNQVKPRTSVERLSEGEVRDNR
jgi:hypothetical protein